MILDSGLLFLGHPVRSKSILAASSTRQTFICGGRCVWQWAPENCKRETETGENTQKSRFRERLSECTAPLEFSVLPVSFVIMCAKRKFSVFG